MLAQNGFFLRRHFSKLPMINQTQHVNICRCTANLESPRMVYLLAFVCNLILVLFSAQERQNGLHDNGAALERLRERLKP
jgi:hypothetical protein